MLIAIAVAILKNIANVKVKFNSFQYQRIIKFILVSNVLFVYIGPHAVAFFGR